VVETLGDPRHIRPILDGIGGLDTLTARGSGENFARCKVSDFQAYGMPDNTTVTCYSMRPSPNYSGFLFVSILCQYRDTYVKDIIANAVV